jgi:hypothetical protein
LDQENLEALETILGPHSVRMPGEIDLPSRIDEGLFLGSWYAALDKHRLLALGVKFVLTVADDLDPPHPDDFEYKVIGLPDVDESDLLPHWEMTHEFISAGIQAGGVLVHCAAGIRAAFDFFPSPS